MIFGRSGGKNLYDVAIVLACNVYAQIASYGDLRGMCSKIVSGATLA